jgi:hypothetical protein
MASDFYDLRPEQVPNAVTQSFPNVHFLAKSSTVVMLAAGFALCFGESINLT